MPTTTGQEIVDQARILLQDVTVGGVRWLDSEMLIWVNAGQREVAVYKPDASTINASVILVPGSKQTIPADATRLSRIIRNMGTDGTTPGRAIRIVEQEILDAQNPDWHTDTASASVKHYIYDKSDPKTFYVTPPQPATGLGYVEMSYPAVPADLTALSDTISIDDIYSNALTSYLMFRSLSKDATYTKKGVDADTYYSAFLTSMGVVETRQQRNDPNRAVGNPNATMSAAQEDA